MAELCNFEIILTPFAGVIAFIDILCHWVFLKLKYFSMFRASLHFWRPFTRMVIRRIALNICNLSYVGNYAAQQNKLPIQQRHYLSVANVTIPARNFSLLINFYDVCAFLWKPHISTVYTFRIIEFLYFSLTFGSLCMYVRMYIYYIHYMCMRVREKRERLICCKFNKI